MNEATKPTTTTTFVQVPKGSKVKGEHRIVIGVMEGADHPTKFFRQGMIGMGWNNALPVIEHMNVDHRLEAAWFLPSLDVAHFLCEMIHRSVGNHFQVFAVVTTVVLPSADEG